jgi:hypothetical protein
LDSKLRKAVRYLQDHFNSKLNLVYESEDPGRKEYGGRTYDHSHIYYMYSDNLLAMHALHPFDKARSIDIAQSLSTLALANNVPPCRFFEALFGYVLPTYFQDSQDKIIKQIGDEVILAEIHNRSSPLKWDSYGNTITLKSLSHFWDRDYHSSVKLFDLACSLWDGKGIFDEATAVENRYANYKLAMILYASQILSLRKDSYSNMEQTLWSMQLSNGGIASLADADGKALGSANCETTSLTLLIYNEELISSLRKIAT